MSRFGRRIRPCRLTIAIDREKAVLETTSGRTFVVGCALLDSEEPQAAGRSVECRSATVTLRARFTRAEVDAPFDVYRMGAAPRRGR